MFPMTFLVQEDCSDVQYGIPISKYMNFDMFLPCGRRCKGFSLNEVRSLLSDMPIGGFRINKDVTATVIYPSFSFAEGDTAWIQLKEDERTRSGLVYFHASLAPGFTTAYLLEKDQVIQVVPWLHPPLTMVNEETNYTSTFGLMILEPGYTLNVTRYFEGEPQSVATLRVKYQEGIATPYLTDTAVEVCR